MGTTRPIRYKDESNAELGTKAAKTWTFTLEPPDDPAVVLLHGPCPKCGDQFDYDWPLTLLRDSLLAPGESARREVRSPTEERITVICRCKVKHPGAAGEPGCGRSWTLTVTVPA